MRTKMALAVLAASTLAAGNMSAFGGVLKSESTPATSEVQKQMKLLVQRMRHRQ